MKLSTTEEKLMQHLWMLEKSFMKDLLEIYPEPKPAITTIATLLKRMTNKGFVGYECHGISRKYYPLVKKKEYFSKHVKDLIMYFFDDSPLRFAFFFMQEVKLTKAELKDLKMIIDNEIKKKGSVASVKYISKTFK